MKNGYPAALFLEIRFEMQRLNLSPGSRVIVSDLRPNGQPHPYAGKTGVIIRLLEPNDEEREKLSYDDPKFGMVELDDQRPPRKLICVSLERLDSLVKWERQ